MKNLKFSLLPSLKSVLALLFLTIGIQSYSQDKEVELSVVFLEFDNISDVNLDQDEFIATLKSYIDFLKEDLKDVPETQKVAVSLVAHKSGPTSLVCFTNPSNETLETKLESGLGKLSAINTKLIDFPILLAANCKSEEEALDFKGLVSPYEARRKTYESADLKTKAKLNREYAINIALPVLAAYETKVDAQFAGVKNFGNLVTITDFNQEQDVLKMTESNSDYWRATLEMEVGNQLIPLTKIYMLVSQGEFDLATRHIEILSAYSKPNSTSDFFMDEISWRMDVFYKDLNAKVVSGITAHDKKNYQEAIKLYDEVLNGHPYSAWAMYERYFTSNQMQVDNKEIEIGDHTNWYKVKDEIYRHNPVYDVSVHASNGQEAYTMFRRQEIQTLFKSKEDRLKDLYTYAEIATDLDAPGLAAQFFWISATFDKERQQNAINHFLYCLDKLGNTDIKSNFKGDFSKVFKKIDAERLKVMKASKGYKMMNEK